MSVEYLKRATKTSATGEDDTREQDGEDDRESEKVGPVEQRVHGTGPRHAARLSSRTRPSRAMPTTQ